MEEPLEPCPSYVVTPSGDRYCEGDRNHAGEHCGGRNPERYAQLVSKFLEFINR